MNVIYVHHIADDASKLLSQKNRLGATQVVAID
jgi:hypothetical protein